MGAVMTIKEVMPWDRCEEYLNFIGAKFTSNMTIRILYD